MSDEEYDIDGDVSRYLQSPGRDSYLFDLPDQAGAATHPAGGQIYHSAAMEAHPAAMQMMNQAAPAMLGSQGPPVDDAGQQQAPAMFGFQGPNIDAGPHDLAPSEFGLQATTIGIEQHAAPAFGLQAEPSMDVEHHLPPAIGFHAQTLSVNDYPESAFGFGIDHQLSSSFQEQIVDIEHHQTTHAFGFQEPNVDVVEHHHQAPPPCIAQQDFQQAPAMNMEPHEAPSFAFHSSTNDVDHGQASSLFVFQATNMDNVAHHQAPAMDVDHHQATVFGFQHAPAMDMEPYQASSFVFQATNTDNVELYQAPAVDDDVEHHHQEPVTDVQTLQALAPEQEGDVDNSSWVDELLVAEVDVIFPPANPPREEELPVENAVEDGQEFVCVPFAHGQLDCTKCHLVREVLHETERRKLYFHVHGADHGAFQHAIIHHMSVDAEGQFHTNELNYVDFRNHSQGSVQNFIESRVEDLKKIGSGRVQDNCSSISATPPLNSTHAELEISMLANILRSTPIATEGDGEAPAESSSQPATNGEQNNNLPEASAQQDSSTPVTNNAEENNDAETRLKPANFLWFTPDILESSQVQPYDPESTTNVLLYPSALQKTRERQQASMANLTMEEALKKFDEIKEEIAREPNLSSFSFKQLCREDKEYRRLACRINELNRKIMKLIEEVDRRARKKGLFHVMQKIEMHGREKTDLFAVIEVGLQEIEKKEDGDPGGAPSGNL